jgi:threonine synthase
MNVISTRRGATDLPLADALLGGTAPDGGLFVPARLPPGETLRGATLPDSALAMLAPFFAGDRLESELPAMLVEAFTFPAPLVPLRNRGDFVVELFHGPTAAFKDFGARFLAACMRRLHPPGAGTRTVLVATSGDTGGAVAAAFHRMHGVRVVLLYPDGRVSPRQAHQLGAFGENVTALRVAGTFDECQAMVKAAFADPELAPLRLTSANSISLGRLLPQLAYHAHAAWASGGTLNLIVPTGNLGNAVAAVWARELGAPIGDIVLATNANKTLAEFFEGGAYHGRPSVPTLANAMDVGDPSNFERLSWTYRTRWCSGTACAPVRSPTSTSLAPACRASGAMDRFSARTPRPACTSSSSSARRPGPGREAGRWPPLRTRRSSRASSSHWWDTRSRFLRGWRSCWSGRPGQRPSAPRQVRSVAGSWTTPRIDLCYKQQPP